MRELVLTSRRLEELIPYARNARTHTDEQVEQIAASIREFGWTNPVLVDEAGGIIAGHGRVKAAERMAAAEVPVIVIAGLSEAQKRAYALADNQIALNSGWDEGLLKFELADLSAEAFDLSIVGFSARALEDIMNGAQLDLPGEGDPEEIPEPPATPVTALGDVWVLGDHRLKCGDSTSRADVDALLAGERKFAVCVTDPPYSVNYDDSHKTRGGSKKVHGAYHEAQTTPDGLLEFLGLVPCDTLIFSYSVDRHMVALVNALSRHKWDIRKELVWVKDSFSFWAGAAYQQRHEPIWVCTRGKGSFRGNVPAKDSTVLEFARPKAHALHPTAKPVGLWRKLIVNHSDRGQLIYEPFSGSGTSIICAHRTGRRCYAMELAPAYVDVAVRRWEAFTGKAAVLEEDSRTFAEVSAARIAVQKSP